MLAYCVGISGGQLRVSCKVFHAANAARHELVHALADVNHAILKPCADLLLGMLHECVMQHPNDRAQRDHGHEQKGEDEFFGQGHENEVLLPHCRARRKERSRGWLAIMSFSRRNARSALIISATSVLRFVEQLIELPLGLMLPVSPNAVICASLSCPCV